METRHVLIPFRFIVLSFFVVIVLGAQDQTITMRELAKGIPFSKWNTSDSNPCNWKGVYCSSFSSHTTLVTQLLLHDLNLSISNSPQFFELLCQLTSLKSLDLSSNSFSFIPSSFFSCKGLFGLKYLNLSSNGLVGPLINFSNFSALETLDLSFNFLEGAVGFKLNELAQLKSLNLSSNFLNDTIPALKGMSLVELSLSNNRFHGGIPHVFLTYDNLTFLDLSRNYLAGSIPGDIGNLPKLETLLLSSNYLEGSIPASLSKIKELSRFAANQNRFNGKIPPGITSHAQFLDLSYNNLYGQIPPDLLSPAALQTVDLSANSLQGPIPSNLSKNLYRLRLGQNSLNGSIPPELGQLLNLTYLELNDNQLEGQIPHQLGNCKNLTLLNLANNQLHGDLPVTLGRLNLLVILELQRNTLTGKIPTELSNLLNLTTLDLSHNSFTGFIPPAISNLNKLQILNLENNNLVGSIPASLSGLQYIIQLLLGNNKLSGTVPDMPTSLSLALNLTGNNLNGSIPSQLGSVTLLEILDLSDNNFTGTVPSSFSDLHGLTELVLSNNRLLSGFLPPLNPKTIVRFAGTGIRNNSASAQGNLSNKKRKPNTVLIVIVVFVGIIAGFLIVAAIVGLILSKRIYRVNDEVHRSEENAIPQIVNGHYITPDTNHRTSIDFSRAMEVVGDPSNAVLKTRFSTYYKATMPNGRSYTVKKLNQSEKILQMGSHEKFERELEVLGRLSNSNIMVPLAYVLTEDSAYFFYEHIHKGTVFDFLHKSSETALDWPSRYSIALGVAQGITFLHSCNQPVLLLDLSTKIILLRSMKEPQIGDIELCKVIDPSNSTGNLSTVAGSVGYIPPEYAYTMRVTMAGNVYSFGVVLLELLTGKPPVSGGIELAKQALGYSSWRNGRERILDMNVCNASPAVRSQMLSVLKIALSCVSSSPGLRPKMRNVLRLLFNAR